MSYKSTIIDQKSVKVTIIDERKFVRSLLIFNSSFFLHFSVVTQRQINGEKKKINIIGNSNFSHHSLENYY